MLTWVYIMQFSSSIKRLLSGFCNRFCLFSQELLFCLSAGGGGGQLVHRRIFHKTVLTRSARMGLIRLQKGPGWEREWEWTTFLTLVAPVHQPAGNGSEYQIKLTSACCLDYIFCSKFMTVHLHNLKFANSSLTFALFIVKMLHWYI